MPNRLREAVLGYLALAGSYADQLQYERSVPVADVPSELICQFADDLFHPSSEEFRAAFSASEVKDLAEFYGRLCVASDALGRDSVTSVKGMLKVPEWRNLVHHARALRARLARDG